MRPDDEAGGHCRGGSPSDGCAIASDRYGKKRRDVNLAGWRRHMAKYLFKACYVGKGVEGLLKEGGTARREAAAKAMASVGGKLESFYYAFGEDDVIGVIDMPDVASATAASLVINASGAVSLKLTPLILPEEVDAASKKHPSYRPPGQ
jgi:uncharacterized protein with GYD domain